MSKLIKLTSLGILLAWLPSCTPNYAGFEKVDNGVFKFDKLNDSEDYLTKELAKGITQKPLGMFVGSTLHDGTHAYSEAREVSVEIVEITRATYRKHKA